MLDLDRGTKLLLEVTASLGLGYTLSWLMRCQQLKQFEKVGTVKELVVYPVKSCQGVYTSEAECTKFGLKVNGVTDRHWMIINSRNRFVSLRHEPKMALISVTITDSEIVLDAPNMTSLRLPKTPGKKVPPVKCSVWESNMEGFDCGDAAALWVSKYFGADGFRMVQYTSDLTKRNYVYEQKFWETTAKEGDYTAYADWATFLLLTDASLEALNKELPSPVTMRTFRPNIILTGTKAFDEDNWSEIRIGDQIHMRCTDACARCTLTTVDPDKGVKRSDGEPLKTLQRIRKSSYHNDGAMFGMNLAPDVCGPIKVGDPVYALRKKAA